MRRTLNDSVPDLLLRLMVERSPDAVALVTPDGTPGFLNTVARELALGVRWTDWWDEPDRGTARAALREADLTGTTRTVTLARTPPDGERAWWTVTVTPVPEADPTRLMCVARDVTRDLAEREDAARQAGRLSRVLNAGPDAFLLLDRAWRVTHVNDRALALLRRPDGASVAGLTLWDLLPDLRDTDADTRLHAAAAARSPEVLETYLADLDLWCELHVSPAEDGVGLSVRDVTARKTAEQIARDRNHVLEMTLRGEPLTAVLEEIALIVERQLPDCWCSVMLVRDGRLHTGAAPSLPQGFNASVDGVPVRDGAGSCGTAAARGEDVMVEDVTTHPAWQDYRELAAAYGLRACRSRPILSGDEVLGTLALYAATPGPLPDGDVLEQARHLAAVAILHTRLSERLRHQAQHDPLTDLPNRSAFARRLQAAIDRAARHEEPLSMLFVDLDDFKTINDTLGHLVGDEVLREAARRLTSVVRRGDTLARIGGDEFTLILPSAGETQAVAVAQRVLGTLQTPFHAEDRDLFLTGSVGVSVFPEGGADGPTLLRHADLAMYQAKVRRAGVTVFRPEMTRDAHERLQLGHELRRALDEDELELHYQPQVRLASGVVAGVEALVRWRHPRLGLG
ncbi:sensor domain-containing protein, partial [Deinococcus pimensis]|uniref:sensor domain-containing protein n=1 Tax=Deinococcus pimensis TaxID=309888 RepID=UPI00146FACA7